ncbi:MAG: branched-chain amino acid ABC transporter substrate-binding protein, partial [Candidatus Dormibacteraeota bacterium]|nr:branched-chain amino acid ABC transporter substrate-binding protein [Candidatus Dormibacteraeota bacterium]
FCVSGMAAAYTMVDVLKQAGNQLTRQHVMDIAAKGLKEKNNPLLLPSIVVQTSKSDHFPIQQEQLQRWEGDHWVPFGQVLSGT